MLIMMGRNNLLQWQLFVVLIIAVAVLLLVDAGRSIQQFNPRVATNSHGVKQHSPPPAFLVRRMQVGNNKDDNDSGMSMPLLILDHFDYEAGILTNTPPDDNITPCFRGSRNLLRKKGTGIHGSEEEGVNCDVTGIGGGGDITNNDGDEEQQELKPATFQEDDDSIPAPCQLGSRNYRDSAGRVRSCSSTFSSVNSNSFEGGVGGIGNNNSNMEAVDIIDIGGSDTTKDDDDSTTTTSTSDAKQDDEIVWVVVDLDNGADSLTTTTTTSDGKDKDSTTTTINKMPPPSSTTTNSTTNSTIILPLADPSTTDTGKGLTSGAIAGIAIAAITSLIVLAVASTKKKILVYRSNRNKNDNEDGGGMDEADDDLAVMDVTHIEKERIATMIHAATPTSAAITRRVGSPDATAITASFSDVTSSGDADSTTHSAPHMGGMVRVLSGSISSIGEETPNGSGGNNMMVTDDSPYFVTPYHTSEMNDYYAKNSLLMTVDDEESMLSTPSFFSSSEEADPVPLSGGSIASATWSVAETIRRINSSTAATPATVTGGSTGGSSLAAMGAAGNAVITSPGGRSSISHQQEEDEEIVVVADRLFL